MSEPTHAPIGDPARRGEDEVTGEFYPSSRDTEIERLAAVLHSVGSRLEGAHGAAALYDAGLRASQPASEPSLDRLDRIIEKAFRWKDAGWYSDGEWPAVAATLFVNDHESLTPEQRERAVEMGRKVAARLSQPADNEAAETAPDFGLQAFTRGFDGAGTDQE